MRSLQRMFQSFRRDCLHMRHAALSRPGTHFSALDSQDGRCGLPLPTGHSARGRCLPQLAHATSVQAAERSSPATATPAVTVQEIEDRLGQLSHVPLVRVLVAGKRLDALTSSAGSPHPRTSTVLASKRDLERPAADWSALQVSTAPAVVVVISGPSGVGKDAVVNALKKARPDLHFVVTATSRCVDHCNIGFLAEQAASSKQSFSGSF